MSQKAIGDTNVDFTQFATVSSAEAEWIDSPEDGVSRIPLDRIGGEMARHVTSIVRYHPGARFHNHDHPGGEEILVLNGVFSDENGNHPVGHYILNPPGYVHEPFSKEGCLIFVKLGQYRGDKRQTVRIDTKARLSEAGSAADVVELPLYSSPDYPERVFLYRLQNGVSLPLREATDGVEIYIIEGALSESEQLYDQGTWLRFPPGRSTALKAAPQCLCYVKLNHLADKIAC